MVLRPDSGDPTEAVMLGLTHSEQIFGSTVNSKGFRVINKIAVLQGDGISIANVQKIYDAVHGAGFSAECVIFGMGGGLLQKVNRDTMSFATKLCYIHYATGAEGKRDIMKKPKTDSGKYSLPGVLQVKRVNGVPTIFPRDADGPIAADDLLQVVYDNGPVNVAWPSFDEIRARAAEEWRALPSDANPLSAEMRAKIDAWAPTFQH